MRIPRSRTVFKTYPFRVHHENDPKKGIRLGELARCDGETMIKTHPQPDDAIRISLDAVHQTSSGSTWRPTRELQEKQC